MIVACDSRKSVVRMTTILLPGNLGVCALMSPKVMSRIAIKGLVMPLIFLVTLASFACSWGNLSCPDPAHCCFCIGLLLAIPFCERQKYALQMLLQHTNCFHNWNSVKNQAPVARFLNFNAFSVVQWKIECCILSKWFYSDAVKKKNTPQIYLQSSLWKQLHGLCACRRALIIRTWTTKTCTPLLQFKGETCNLVSHPNWL